MTVELRALCVDAAEPARLATFWGAVLGWQAGADHVLIPTDDTIFGLEFLHAAERKTWQNQMHFDLTSTSLDDQQQTVARALDLGARHLDIGQRPEEGHVVLADPEGNEFCVIGPGNNFLAGCGFLGAVAGDGSYQVGRFWHDALGWPLVWDEGEETAIRSSNGGPKISWGGTPFPPKSAKNRLHYDLVVDPGQHDAERDRLVSLGASTVAPTHQLASATAMADPDGNEFCLLARRERGNPT